MPYTEQSSYSVIVELHPDKCPNTVANFLKLCKDKKGYKGSTVHRVVKGAWLQLGDLKDGSGRNNTVSGGKDEQFADESFQLKHAQTGVLSMANHGPHTNGSQFFITQKELPSLDGKHVAFGQVSPVE